MNSRGSKPSPTGPWSTDTLQSTTDLEDSEVIGRYRTALLAGDSAAPGELLERVNQVFARHWSMVYAVCRSYSGDPERARDLAQDTMLRAFTRISQYRGDARFRTWLYTVARSVCISALRRPGELLLEDGVLSEADPAASALRSLRQRERDRLIADIVGETLTPLEQEAVVLRYIERLPQERITELLDLDAASGARGLLQRCRRKLRRELQRRLAEMGVGTSFVRDSQ